MESFGDWLVWALGKREWSQRRLATALGVTHTTVSRWARGKRLPDPEQVRQIAGLLDVGIEQAALAYFGITGRDGAQQAALAGEPE